MLGFALIWIATSHGPGAVALVSMLGILPPVILTLLGGVLGDRHGPRQTLLVTSGAELTALVALLAVAHGEPTVIFLATAAAVTSTISAISRPSATVYARLLIRDDEQLPRALARISGSLHAARILGVAAGGMTLSFSSLSTVLAVNAVLTALCLAVLSALRSQSPPSSPTPLSEDGGIWRALKLAISSAHALRIWPLLAAVALVCSAVLPVVAVVLPSWARANDWSASQASLLESAWAAGTLTVTLLIAATGTLTRQNIALIGGPVLIAGALAALALPLGVTAAILSSALLGVGTAVFTTHIAPALLRLAPAGQMTRFQALMGVVQLAPPALLNSPFAALSGSGHASFALLLASILAIGAALTIVLGERIRAAHLGP